jgi:hypothetical protein
LLDIRASSRRLGRPLEYLGEKLPGCIVHSHLQGTLKSIHFLIILHLIYRFL